MQREGGILSTSSPATLAGLLAAILVAWGLVVWPAMTMHTGSMHSGLVHLMMPGTAVWTPTNVAAVFVMWSVMMAAMMLPGAVPMVLLYRQLVARRQPEVARRRSILFTGAYLVAWAGYSIAATGMQWGLQAGLVLSPMGVKQNRDHRTDKQKADAAQNDLMFDLPLRTFPFHHDCATLMYNFFLSPQCAFKLYHNLYNRICAKKASNRST